MSYDFYVKFWANLDIELKKWVNEKWNNIMKNLRIEWDKKPKELENVLEKDTKIFRQIVVNFLREKEGFSLVQYAKLQRVVENFLEENEEKIKSYIHSLLKKSIRGYNRSKSPINKLKLSENPKQSYVSFIHPQEDVWFKIHGDIIKQIKNLEIDPKYIEESKITQVLQNLPENSKFIKVAFTLKKPFISQDDEEFYPIDNPICKDKVFKIPYVRPSSWKGALRYAALRVILEKLERKEPKEVIINTRLAFLRLFGTEKDKIEEFLDERFGKELTKKFKEEAKKIYKKDKYEDINLRGRLVFYPTFFGQIGLDVIAPHDRKTKTPARGPILFEIVPERAEGDFCLLYFPLGLTNGEEIKEDLKLLKEVIPAMLTKYGFGAKTTAGYGVIENKVKFQILPAMKKEKDDENFGERDSAFVKEMNALIKNYGEEHD